MLNFRQRKWLYVAIAIAIVVVLTLIAAPSGNKNNSGSTYGRGPDGYGAWYEYMSNKGIPIQRWEQPFGKFVQTNDQGATYIKIRSKIDYLSSTPNLSPTESDWVKKGNTLVIVGTVQPATAAPFKSSISFRDQPQDRPLSSLQVEIETARRRQSSDKVESLLSDRYGAVVWSEKVGKGKVIYSTTPFLAANAYQDSWDNYEFLAQLVSDNKAIWVDEYIHGYKDKETIANEEEEGILNYFARTPLYLLFLQMIIIGGIVTAAAFRPFGKPLIPKTVIVDNSTAYIDALAGVLEKANSTDFVVDTIGKDEQQKLQASLGLGRSLVEHDNLIAACKQQKQESTVELAQLLAMNQAQRKISDAQLITWMQKWQKINRTD